MSSKFTLFSINWRRFLVRRRDSFPPRFESDGKHLLRIFCNSIKTNPIKNKRRFFEPTLLKLSSVLKIKPVSIFAISATLVSQKDNNDNEVDGTVQFNDKELYFFHYFLRLTGRRSLSSRSSAETERSRQPFEPDTVDQIVAILKDKTQNEDVKEKYLSQLIIYAEQVIEYFEKGSKKSNQIETEDSGRLEQWKEILTLLKTRRDSNSKRTK